MTSDYLDFEKPLFELERKIEELRRFTADGNSIDIKEDITKLEKKAHQLRVDIFSNLTPWQKVQLARHPNRPYALDYINLLTEDFLEMHGDRSFGDDAAILSGLIGDLALRYLILKGGLYSPLLPSGSSA